jgi:5-methylcytosine-specific restriction enzyme subunit McrC
VKNLELFEWDNGSKQSTFSESELRVLKKLNDQIRKKEGADAITVTYGKIFTYSYVGILQIGKKRIEILPKLYNPILNRSLADLEPDERKRLYRNARKNLFSLLSAAGLIPFYKSGMSHYGDEKDFFEFMIALFLTDLESCMGTHFHHEYLHREEECVHLKGKLDYRHQILKLPSELHKFSCMYDEFTIDNPINRVIKATVKMIQELCRSEENRKRAYNFYSFMSDVEDEIIGPHYVSKIHFNRLNEIYKQIIEFCFLILFGSVYSPYEGTQEYYALIFDMNLVFERYMTRLLRSSLQEYSFDYQESKNLASRYEPKFEEERTKKPVIPDIVVRDEKKTVAVIDTKYKLDLTRGYISNSDTYQMIAYCVASECDKALLLYPRLPGQNEPKEREHFIVLDKLQTERKAERTTLIQAFSIQMLDERGKILKQLIVEDRDAISSVLKRQITPMKISIN